MAERIALFGGTSEGRELADLCREVGIECHVFVATGTGEEFLRELSGDVRIHAGRLQEEDMVRELLRLAPSYVLDATHPYAVEVSRNLKAACRRCGIRCLRVCRDRVPVTGDLEVSSAAGAACILRERYADVPVLLTTGTKELKQFQETAAVNPELYARILPGEENRALAVGAGILPEHIIEGVGPFSEEENYRQMRERDIRVLVTKESGRRGGYEEKLRAASRAGAVSIVIRRPQEEDGITMEQAQELITHAGPDPVDKTVTIIGCGMGGRRGMTVEACSALDGASLVIGAGRWIDALGELRQGAEVRCLAGYRTDEISEAIREAKESHIALLVSGDSGFYSAAGSWVHMLESLGVRVEILPGISCVSALAARTGCGWEDAQIFSLHGRQQNYYSALAAGEKIILLGADGFGQVLEELCALGYGEANVWIGQNMGGPRECILHGTPRSLAGQADEPLSVLMICPGRTLRRSRTSGLSDESFIRGKVPMTKSEVRAVCMSRLAVGPHDTVYDIGAGTGSISVEASIAASRGKVLAIEKEEKALPLIRQNAERFLCRNLEVIHGEAPEALRGLIAPDAVMIGGSGGRLREILEAVLAMNPRVRIVMTAASLETLQEAQEAAGALALEAEYTQIAATRIVRRGDYHMMDAQNPVWVISMERNV